MFIITFKANGNNVDEKIEKLQINDIWDVYYESPLNIITDNWGYDYEENKNELLDLNISFNGARIELDPFIKKLEYILKDSVCNVKELNYEYEEVKFPAIEIGESWVLAHPDEIFENKNKINFISQGAFGTGLHETTKDLLNLILNIDFTDKSVMDIGTGSGILSIATAIKGANNVTAIDIRNVSDEISLNAQLNNLQNIDIKIGNALENDFVINDKFDWIYINIGGEETKMFINYINQHLKENGMLLVSGLVEWSFESIKTFVEENGYIMQNKLQTNEWCTAIFKKI